MVKQEKKVDLVVEWREKQEYRPQSVIDQSYHLQLNGWLPQEREVESAFGQDRRRSLDSRRRRLGWGGEADQQQQTMESTRL